MLGPLVVVALGITVLVGTTLGRRYRVAPPAILLLFLPAILCRESLNTSLREIRANLRVTVLSSVVLVIVTMVVVSPTPEASRPVSPSAGWSCCGR